MLIVMGILAGLGWAAGQNGNQNQKQGPTVVPPATTTLSAEETANILRMREEEKMARDVYQVFAELWKAPIFTNIAAAEQRHMDAVGLLITKYGLDDPVIDDTIGVFSSESGFAELYTTLTGSGTKSLLDALEAGVQIEEDDIADLETALSQTDKSDIQWVFGNLLRGSSNHLRAFTRCIEAGGTGCSLQGTSGGTGNGKGADNVCARVVVAGAEAMGTVVVSETAVAWATGTRTACASRASSVREMAPACRSPRRPRPSRDEGCQYMASTLGRSYEGRTVGATLFHISPGLLRERRWRQLQTSYAAIAIDRE